MHHESIKMQLKNLIDRGVQAGDEWWLLEGEL
jgi:hypothetical protein